MMGILTASSRVDVIVGDKPGSFKKVSQTINDNGGDIINVGMTAQQVSKRIYYFRLSPCNTAEIKSALESEGFEVVGTMD